MKPGELERQLSHLTQVAREAQVRLNRAMREVGELRRALDGGTSSSSRSVSEVKAPDAKGAVGVVNGGSAR